MPDDIIILSIWSNYNVSSTEIKTSSIPFSGDGVFTNIPLQTGVLFGPYVGVKVAPGVDKNVTDTSYMWEVSVLHSDQL